jgi:hypothetical protein
MFAALVSGWVAWAMVLTAPPGVLVFVMLLVLLGGLGPSLAIGPIFRPLVSRESGIPRRTTSRRILIFAVAAALITVAGALAIHSKVPIISAERVAIITPQGHRVLVSRGQIVRELSVDEYHQIVASRLASIATVGNLVLAVSLVALGGGLATAQRLKSR